MKPRRPSGSPAPSNTSTGRRRSRLLALEPRILFDGVALVDPAQADGTAGRAADSGRAASVAPAMGRAAGEVSRDAAPRSGGEDGSKAVTAVIDMLSGKREVAFYDPRLDGIGEALAQLGAHVELVALEAGRDGIEQVRDALAQGGPVSAVHIIGHGSTASFALGDTTLDLGALEARSADLRAWAGNLGADADILLYGCDIAGDAQGLALVARLGELTGADVAASTDTTGAQQRGGDWDLEARSGDIETATLALSGFQGVLAAPVFSAPPADQSINEDGRFDFSAVFDTNADDSARTSLQTAGMTWDAQVDVVRGSGMVGQGDFWRTSLSTQADRDGINGFLSGLSFRPTANWHGEVEIRLTVKNYSESNPTPVSLVFKIQVLPVADAPNTGALASLAAIAEDSTNPAGVAVGSLVPNFSDGDGNTLAGIAISGNGAGAAQGRWEYSTDGASWHAVGNVGSGAALLLDTSAKLRFVPAADWSGTPGSLTLHAVDNSGSRSFSSGATRALGAVAGTDIDSNGRSLTTSVTPVNDAPVADPLSLSVDKNGSVAVALPAHDVDGTVTKYKIVGIADLHGTLYVDGNKPVTAGMELTAAQAANLRFAPEANYTGAASFTFQAIDDGSASSNVATASITVRAVNLPPSLVVPGALEMNEDAAPLVLAGLSVADVDGGEGLEQLTVSATQGTISLGSGAGLEVIGSSAHAITVRGSLAALNAALSAGKLSYAPGADFNGSDTITVTIDDLGNTGPSSATATKTIAVTVRPVADAPRTGSAQLPAVPEDTLDPGGARLSQIMSGATDADGDSILGFAISADASTAAQGQWQYSVDDGVNWLALGSVSRDAALVLGPAAKLRFVPAADFHGAPGALTVHAIDSSAGPLVSTGANGRTTLAIVPSTSIDAQGGELGTSITSVDDGLVVDTQRELRVEEGGRSVLGTGILALSSRGLPPASIVYTIVAEGTDLGAGKLSMNGAELSVGSTFTQADIDAGRIAYEHGGAEPTAQSIAYRATDGSSTSTGSVVIRVSPVNDAPVLYVPGQSAPDGTLLAAHVAGSGGSFGFSTAAVRIADPDNTDLQLVFRIESLPLHGELTLGGAAVAPGVVFSYADLGKLVYTHDGSTAAADGFTVTLRDGAGATVAATLIQLTIGTPNHAPTGIGSLTTTVFEDPTSYGARAGNDGVAIESLSGYQFADIDAGASVGGLAIVGNSADPQTQGRWEYSTGGGKWSAIGTVNDNGGALVLAPSALVRFVPVADYNGVPPALQVRVLDNTYQGGVSSSAGSETRVTIDTSAGKRGGSTAIADHVDTLGVTVIAVNDDPVLVANGGIAVAKPGQTVTVGAEQLRATDVENDTITYLLGVLPAHGVLLLDGKPVGVGQTFTQADIDSGKLQYRNIDGKTDSFTVTVRDGKYNAVLDRAGGIYEGDSLKRIEVPVTIGPVDTGPGGGIVANDDVLVTHKNIAIDSNPAANDGGTGTLTITGVSNAVNGTVTLVGQQVHFVPAAGFVGTDSFDYSIRDEAGRTATGHVTVYVLATNEAPTLAQAPLTLDEGAVATITGLHLNAQDPDNTAAQLTYTLTALAGLTNGALYYDAGGTSTTLGAQARRLYAGSTFTQQDILDGRIKFVHDGGEDFLSSFKFRLTDGSAHIAQELSFEIDVTPVNDRPSIAGGTVKVVQGQTVVLDGAMLSASDVDGKGSDKSGGYAAINTLSFHASGLPQHGELRVVVAGKSYDAADASTYRVVGAGTVLSAADIATGLRYVHGGAGTSEDTISFSVDDGSGAANSSNSAPVTVRIIPVNAYPEVIVNTGFVLEWNPAGDTVVGNGKALYEGGARVIKATDLLGKDADNIDPAVQFRVTANVRFGQLLRDGQLLGVGSAFTVQDLRDELISYVHDGRETPVATGSTVHSDYFGFTLSDGSGGNGDDGSTRPDVVEPTGRFNIDIIQVNDTPVITTTGERRAVEEVPLAIPGIVVTDPDSLRRDGSIDASHGPLKVTLSVGHGTLKLTPGAATVAGSGTSTVVLTGSQGDINAALATLVYTGNKDFNGMDAVSILVDDQGLSGVDPDLPDVPGTGDGSPSTNETARASLSIKVGPVDDAPVHTVPGAQSVNEDTSLVFSAAGGNAITVSDIDVAETPGGQLSTTITAGHGTLSVAAGGLAVTGNGSGTLTLTGTREAINAALDGLVYQAAADYHGADTLVVLTSDLGNTGLGGPLVTRDTVAINVLPVNDPPVTSDISLTVAEDTVLRFDLAASEADGGTAGEDADVTHYVIVSLPAHGVLKTSDGQAVGAGMRITVAQATGMTFTPDADFNSKHGSVAFAFLALDATDTASNTSTVGITVTAVNDAPAVTGAGDTVDYTEGLGPASAGAPVVLDADRGAALASDIELIGSRIEDNFKSSTLTVRRQGAEVGSDRYGIDTSYAGDGMSVTVAGTVVKVDGQDVADLAGGSGKLVITFRETASRDSVSALMKRITFSSVADNLQGAIKVELVFSDGNAGEQGTGGALSASGVFTVNVTPTNDAPTGSDGNLAPVKEDAGNTNPPNSGNVPAPGGATVQSLFGAQFKDADTPGGGSAVLAGIAIVGNAALESQGRWQYMVDGSGTWQDIPLTGLDKDHALVLGTNDKLRFNPSQANYNGAVGSLTVRLSDGSNFARSTSVSDLKQLAVGNTDGWSGELALKTSVSKVNDAPTIGGLDEDRVEFVEAIGVNVPGIAVLLDNKSAGQLATLFDHELTERLESPFTGATLTVQNGGTADTSDFFVVQNGVAGLSTMGDSTLLGPNVRLYENGAQIMFNNQHVATITENSAASGRLVLTFTKDASKAAVDAILQNLAYSNDNDALAAGTKTIAVTFSDGNTGAQGEGGALATTVHVKIDLKPSNDAPSFKGGATIAMTEDQAAATERTLDSLLAAQFTDPDNWPDNFAGVAISAFDSAQLGKWQVKLGADWVDLTQLAGTDGVSPAKALLLAKDTAVRFVANEHANTAAGAGARPSFTLFAVERAIPLGASDAAAPALVFTSDPGQPRTVDTTTDSVESRVSAGSVKVDVDIAARNDAPVLAETGDKNLVFRGTLEESGTSGAGTAPLQLLKAAEVTDLDLGTTGTLNAAVFGAGRIDVALQGGVSGDQLKLEGNLAGVASVSGGADGAALVITLRNSATLAQVNLILEAIRFQHTGDTPPTAERSFTITLSDGNNNQGSGKTAGGPGALSAVLQGAITIVQANDPPQVDLNGAGAGTGHALTWTEAANAPHVPVQVMPDAILSDVDNTNLVRMVLTLGGVRDGNHEVLTIGGHSMPLGTSIDGAVLDSLTLSYDSATGILTLAPADGATVPLASLQALLRGMTYVNTTDHPTAGERFFDVEVVDAGADNAGTDDPANKLLPSNKARLVLNVVPSNDQPRLSGLDPAVFHENRIQQAPAWLDRDITLTEVDKLDYAGATLTVSGLQSHDIVSLPSWQAGAAADHAGEVMRDGATLRYSDGTAWIDIGSVSGGQGSDLVMVLNASATAAIAERVLESLQFQNTSDAPVAKRTLTYTVNDGAGNPANVVGTALEVTIVRDNDAPAMTGSVGGTYVENAAPIAIVGGTIGVADPDAAADLAGGSLRVQLDRYIGGDQLSILSAGTGAGQISIDGAEIRYGNTVFASFSGGAGSELVIGFKAGATPAAVAALLGQLRFANGSSDPTLGNTAPTRTVTITLDDGGNRFDGGADVATFLTAKLEGVIQLQALQTPPVIATVGNAHFTENGGPVKLASALSLSDADDGQATGATVRIANGLVPGADSLGVAGTAIGATIAGTNIQVVSYDAANGTLVLAGADSMANYQAALRQVTFDNSSEDPVGAQLNAQRTIVWTVTDANVNQVGAAAGTASSVLTLHPVNDAPTQDGLDAVSANLYVQGGPAIVIDADVGTDDFELAARDNWRGATLSIARAGTASADDVFGVGGRVQLAGGKLSVDGAVIGSFSQAGGRLTITFDAQATTARVNETLRSLTYANSRTAAGALAYDSVTLRITIDDQNTDVTGGGSAGGSGGQEQGAGGRQAVSGDIKVNINRLPLAGADLAAVAEGIGKTDASAVSGNLLVPTSDTDPDNDSLTVQGVLAGSAGVSGANVGADLAGSFGSIRVQADGSYTYTLDNTLDKVQQLAAGETLSEVFTYTVGDGRGGIATSTLTITITGTNDAPVVSLEDVTGAVTEPVVAAGMLGDSGTLGFTDVDLTDTHAITVTPKGTPLGTLVAGKDSDTTGTGIGGKLTWTYSVAAGAIEYLAAGQTRIEQFDVKVDDGHGGVVTRTIEITITGTNDAPVLADTVRTIVQHEDAPAPLGAVGSLVSALIGAGGSSDADGNAAAHGIALLGADTSKGNWLYSTDGGASWQQVGAVGAHAALLLGPDARLYFQPHPDLNTSAPIGAGLSFRAWDGSMGQAGDTAAIGTPGNGSAFSAHQASVTLEVTPVNDAPTIRNLDAVSVNASPDRPYVPGGGGIVIDPDIGFADRELGTERNDWNGATLTLVRKGGASGDDLFGAKAGGPLALSGGQVTVAGTVIGTYALGNGTLSITFNGNAGTSQVELAAQNITYTNALATPAYSSVTLVWTLDDGNRNTNGGGLAGQGQDQGQGGRAQAAAEILISLNQPPVANQDAAVAVEAGGNANGSAGIDPQGNVLDNDTDPDPLDTKTVTNPGTYQGTYGSLVLAADGSYTYTLDNGLVDVERLREAGQTLTDSFAYAMRDAAGLTSTSTLTITIRGSNDAPVAVNDTAVAVEAGGLNNGSAGTDPSGNVLVNDTDVDSGDSKTVTTTGDLAGQYGTLKLNADGSYTYVVDNSNAAVQALRTSTDTLTDTISYTMRDAAGATSTATLTVTIQGANDTPVAVDDTVVAVEAGGIANGTAGIDPAGNVLANDTDVDSGDSKTVTTTGDLAGQYGTLKLNADGSYTYVVDNNNVAVQALRTSTDTLTDTISYTMRDAAGATSTATLTVTIQGANDTPVAVDDTAVAVEAGGLNNGTAGTNPSGNVLANDTDIDSGDSKTVTTTGDLAGQYGTLKLNADGSYTYVVDNSNAAVQALRTSTDTLTDTISYTMRDAAGATSTATLTVTIQGANDTPVAVDDTAVAVEAGGLNNGTAGTNPSGNVLANDTDIDSGDSKTVTTTGDLAGQYGTLKLNADGSYTYVVDNSNAAVQALRTSTDTLTDTISYTMRDSAGATSTATLTVTIRGANDTPIAVNDSAVAVEAGGLNNGSTGTDPSGNVLANDTDVDSGDSKTVTTTGNLAGQYGTLKLNADGSYTYVVDNSNAAVQALRTSTDTLTDTISYTMRDAAGATSTATLTVTIRDSNDAPVALNDTAVAVEAGGLNNGSAGTNPSGNVLANDTDVDSGDSKTVTTTGDLAGRYGTLKLNADGSYTYVVDNSNAAVHALRTSADTLTDTISYTMRDAAGATSTATLTVTIQGANDTPVAMDDTAVAVEAGGLNNASAGTNPSGNVLANDTDVDSGDSKTVTTTGDLAGQYGTLKLNADGSYTYVVDNSNAAVQALRTSADTLTDTISYTMRDSAGATSTATLTVTIRGANDTPVAVNDTAVAAEAGGVANGTAGIDPAGNVLANDTDVDSGDSKTVATTGDLAGRYGTLKLNADGSYTYVVDNSNAAVQSLRTSTDTLTDTISYTMRDAAGATSTATLTVTIRGANDTPIAVNDTAVAVEAGGLNNGTAGTNPSGNVLANDTDVDSGDSKTVTTAGQMVGSYGTLTLNADGSYTYVVDNDNPVVQALRSSGETLTETFAYTMRDSAGATGSATLTVTVRGANDAPVAVDDTAVAVEAGGVANGTAGINPSGNVLANDTDVDAGDSKTVTTTGTLAGQYGSLTLNADGSYVYVVDNAHPAVQALRTQADTLADTIRYTVTDAGGATHSATLTVTIRGANDTPAARDDSAAAVEAGGMNNETPGTQASGNVLANDTDIDAGERFTVTSAGTFTGLYGVLVLNADGSYVYQVNNANPAVEALAAGQSLAEQFTYTMRDLDGLTHGATLTVTIGGVDDVLRPPELAVPEPVPQQPAPGTPAGPDGAAPGLPAGPAAPAGPIFPGNGGSSTSLLVFTPPFQIENGASRLQLQVSQSIGSSSVGQGNETDVRRLESTDRGFPVERLKAQASTDTAIDNQQKGGDRLFTYKGIGNTFATVGSMLDYHVPQQAFGHTDPAAIVQLEAMLSDGNPLPEWMEFDPTSGVFSGRPPADAGDGVEIKVTARDNDGRETSATFRIRVEGRDGAKEDARETAGKPAPETAARPGKDVAKRGATAFSDQIKLARRGDPLLDALMSLVEPAKPAKAAKTSIQKTSV